MRFGESHSTRVRGLKYLLVLMVQTYLPVALYTSAWIEIGERYPDWIEIHVALYTSAWIEISGR